MYAYKDNLGGGGRGFSPKGQTRLAAPLVVYPPLYQLLVRCQWECIYQVNRIRTGQGRCVERLLHRWKYRYDPFVRLRGDQANTYVSDGMPKKILLSMPDWYAQRLPGSYRMSRITEHGLMIYMFLLLLLPIIVIEIVLIVNRNFYSDRDTYCDIV